MLVWTRPCLSLKWARMRIVCQAEVWSRVLHNKLLLLFNSSTCNINISTLQICLSNNPSIPICTIKDWVSKLPWLPEANPLDHNSSIKCLCLFPNSNNNSNTCHLDINRKIVAATFRKCSLRSNNKCLFKCWTNNKTWTALEMYQ